MHYRALRITRIFYFLKRLPPYKAYGKCPYMVERKIYSNVYILRFRVLVNIGSVYRPPRFYLKQPFLVKDEFFLLLNRQVLSENRPFI